MAIIVPPNRLSADVLNGLIEEFVSRDGTDYGVEEVSLEEKVSQVKVALNRGEAFILFDELSETCDILSKQEALERGFLED